MNRTFLSVLLAVFLLPASAMALTAKVELKATSPESTVTGQVQLKEVPGGLWLRAQVSGTTVGKHGIHIHETGECGDMGKMAGGHFNPDGNPHGDVMRDGLTAAHAGDLGNIEIGDDGSGVLELVVPGLTLQEGKYGVMGRSVILHEKEDDFSQPLGNAGARIACGPIELEF